MSETMAVDVDVTPRSPKRRRPTIPKATAWETFTPAQAVAAIRDVRRLVLDRLAVSPCCMLMLRQALPHRIAAALVPAMEALVEAGVVTAIGPGLYAIVAEPDGRVVLPAPGRDLVVACLAMTDKRADVRRYTGVLDSQVGAHIAKAVKRGEIDVENRRYTRRSRNVLCV